VEIRFKERLVLSARDHDAKKSLLQSRPSQQEKLAEAWTVAERSDPKLEPEFVSTGFQF